MKMKRDFVSGYLSAVADLGREGDNRCVDWSEPYAYLKERLNTFEVVSEGLVEQLLYRGGLCVEAADEIERLQAEVNHLSGPDPHGYKAAAEENLRRLSKGGAS